MPISFYILLCPLRHRMPLGNGLRGYRYIYTFQSIQSALIWNSAGIVNTAGKFAKRDQTCLDYRIMGWVSVCVSAEWRTWLFEKLESGHSCRLNRYPFHKKSQGPVRPKSESSWRLSWGAPMGRSETHITFPNQPQNYDLIGVWILIKKFIINHRLRKPYFQFLIQALFSKQHL